MLQHVPTKRSKILKGYAAFTDGDWDAIRELLCDNVRWHRMHHDGDPHEDLIIDGKEKVIEHLQELRGANDVELKGVAIQDNIAITVDYTRSTDEHIGDHGCADRIEFDASGRIKEVWHCAAGTHDVPPEPNPAAT